MSEMQFGRIVQIDNILVSEDILDWFACDYELCKGQCCISGDCGAPMLENEAASLERQYPSYENLLSEQGKVAISKEGFSQPDPKGHPSTPLVPGSGVCAFAHIKANGDCLCAIEKAGGIKPISCSLYPVRAVNLNGGGTALNVHCWDICQCARDKGRREKIRVYQFLRQPLVRAYGKEFYDRLCSRCEELLLEYDPFA